MARRLWEAEHGRKLGGRKPTPPDRDALAERKINTSDPDYSLRRAGVEAPIGTVLADGGYWNSAAISEVRRHGIDVLVPTQDRRRSKPREAFAPPR